MVWNTAALLDRCLATLPDALGPLTAEIVVVDNASEDGSAEVAERHGAAVIRNPVNVGYGRGMNQALAGTSAEFLVALNPDTEPGPGSLHELIGRIRAAPDVGLVAPRLLNPDGTDQHSVYRFPSPAVAIAVAFVPSRWQASWVGRRWWLEGFADHRRSTDVDWAIGAVHVIRAEALQGGLPYSERWFMYVEDLDLCWRLDQHGWRRRLEADVAIPHVGNAAGAIRWGDSRTSRWIEATYDWYRLARGRRAMTTWAMANSAGLLWLIGRRGVIGAVDPSRRGAAKHQIREFSRVLPQHLRILVWGPRVE